MKTLLVTVPDKDEVFFTALLKKFNFKTTPIQKAKIDLWDEIPDEIKADVEIALKELDQGKGIPHEKAMKKYAKWIKK